MDVQTIKTMPQPILEDVAVAAAAPSPGAETACGTITVSADKIPRAKVGISFALSATVPHVVVLHAVTPQSIFAENRAVLEGREVVAVGGVPPRDVRHAADMVTQAAQVVQLTVQAVAQDVVAKELAEVREQIGDGNYGLRIEALPAERFDYEHQNFLSGVDTVLPAAPTKAPAARNQSTQVATQPHPRGVDAAVPAAAALPPPSPGAETTPRTNRSTGVGARAPPVGTVAVGMNPNQLTQVATQPHPLTVDAAAPAAAAPPPPSPGAETTPRTNISTGVGARVPPVGTVAMGMNPNQLTQEFTGASPSVAGSVVSDLSMSVGAPRAGERVSNTPATTARRRAKPRARAPPGTKPKVDPKCKIGARVVVERKHLNLRVTPGEPARVVLDLHNQQNYNFYGHVTGKAKHAVWNVVFDLFPSDQPPLSVARTHMKKVLRPDDESPAYDREQESEPEDLAPTQAARKAGAKKGKKDFVKESFDSFRKLDQQAMLDARSFKYRYGEKEDESIVWDILSEQEQIVQCPMELGLAAKEAERQGTSSLKPGGMSSGEAGATTEELHGPLEKYSPLWKDIPWNSNPSKVDWSGIFFEHFWPSLEGKAKVADEILHDIRCGYFNRATAQGIRFCRPGLDPDFLVSFLFYLCFVPCIPLTIPPLFRLGSAFSA